MSRRRQTRLLPENIMKGGEIELQIIQGMPEGS
jgi:hypothetical protein